MEQNHPVAEALVNNEGRRRMWEELFRHEGWRELVAYLEKRYLEVGKEECDSLVKLHGRNARLSEIRKLFAFVMHDFRIEDALIKEYQSLMDTGTLDENFAPHLR